MSDDVRGGCRHHVGFSGEDDLVTDLRRRLYLAPLEENILADESEFAVDHAVTFLNALFGLGGPLR